MDKKTILWIVIGVLVIGLIFLTLSKGNTSIVQSAGSAVKSASASSSGMVGGC